MASDQPLGSHRGLRTRAHPGEITRGAWASWLVILVLTGIIHVIRQAPLDAAIFFGCAAILAADVAGWMPLRGFARMPRRVVVMVLIALATVALTLSPLYGLVDTLVVIAIGLAVLPFAWPHPLARSRTQASPAVRRAAIAWAAVGIVGCLWELLAFFLSLPSPQAEYANPPLSDLVDPFIAAPLSRAVLIAIWLLGGYALMRRGPLR